MPEVQGDSSDEWETETVVVEINGVLDARAVRQAVAAKQITLRRHETDKPLLQVGNSLFTGKWLRTVGTDLILQADGGQNLKDVKNSVRNMEQQHATRTVTSQISLNFPRTAIKSPVIAASDKMLKTEKALMTAVATSAMHTNTGQTDKDRPPQRQCKK